MLGLLILALFIAVFVIAPLYFIFMGAASLLPGGPPGGPDRAEDGGDQCLAASQHCRWR